MRTSRRSFLSGAIAAPAVLPGAVLGQAVQSLGRALVFLLRWNAPPDRAWMAIQRAAIGHGPKRCAKVDLFLVPGQAALALSSLLGGQVTGHRPFAAWADDQFEAERLGPTPRELRSKAHVVANADLKNVQTQCFGLVQQYKLVV